MERAEYDAMAGLEDHMWWYRVLHALIGDRLVEAGIAATTGAPLVDFGCGTGGLLKRLAARLPGVALAGVEYDAAAAATARAKSGAAVAVGSIVQPPLADGAAAAIVSADVLSHRLVDPPAALREAHRCLRLGGILVLNLPAYRWMLSAHDREVHNARRFTRGEAVGMVAAAGFAVRRATYWNMFLFPLMALRRLVAGGGSSDVKPFPAPIDALFGAVTGVERWLIARGLALPFGGSILVVAEKR
ncbi:MAG: class I SAM-dependent methyltransferase [Rhodospirillales bacterium]|nr:MAG: class I SAM-dependent methyltransferase [Rhodospirillales bacterium]